MSNSTDSGNIETKTYPDGTVATGVAPLPDASPAVRFPRTYCSQCGGEFGPGDSGFSHCEDHQKPLSASELLDALRMILPMAKSYAKAHPVGQNSTFIEYAECLIAKATGAAA